MFFSLRSLTVKLLLLKQSPTSLRTFSTTTRNMSTIETTSWADAIKSRRTFYQLSASSPIPDSRIAELVNLAVKHSPSSFNSQSSRAVLLLGEHHTKVWDFAKEALQAIVPAEAWPSSESRLNGFQKAYGTILLFEDQTVISALQEKLPTYAQKFPEWSGHAHGILAANLWTALEVEGFGANLQHYNPLIDAKVAAEWEIPASWTLTAQLVFGKNEGGPAGEKEFKSLEERVKVFGARL